MRDAASNKSKLGARCVASVLVSFGMGSAGFDDMTFATRTSYACTWYMICAAPSQNYLYHNVVTSVNVACAAQHQRERFAMCAAFCACNACFRKSKPYYEFTQLEL